MEYTGGERGWNCQLFPSNHDGDFEPKSSPCWTTVLGRIDSGMLGVPVIDMVESCGSPPSNVMTAVLTGLKVNHMSSFRFL
jgi:hypothetical protein